MTTDRIQAPRGPRGSSRSPGTRHGPSASRSVRPAPSPSRRTASGSSSCARRPAPSAATGSGCSTWLAAATERIAADPDALLGGRGEQLSAQERARRERSREGSAGIVAYATDAAVELAAFALSGRLFTAELRAGTARELPVPGPVLDPRPSPDGRHVAYVARGALRVVGAEGERRPGARRARVARSDVRARGVHRRGGDVPLARPLVEPRLRPPARGPRGRERRAALVDRRPGQPRRGAGAGRLSGGGHAQRRGARSSCTPWTAPAPRSSGTGPATPISPGFTGPRTARRCCSSSPGTSAPNSISPWTRRRARPAPCTSTRTPTGSNSFRAAPPGHPTAVSCGSPTRAGRVSSRWATGP